MIWIVADVILEQRVAAATSGNDHTIDRTELERLRAADDSTLFERFECNLLLAEDLFEEFKHSSELTALSAALDRLTAAEAEESSYAAKNPSGELAGLRASLHGEVLWSIADQSPNELRSDAAANAEVLLRRAIALCPWDDQRLRSRRQSRLGAFLLHFNPGSECRDQVAEAVQLLKHSLDQDPQDDATDRPLLLANLGHGMRRSALIERARGSRHLADALLREAVKYYNEANRLAETLDHVEVDTRTDQALALGELAQVADDRSLLDQAIAVGEVALSARAVDDPHRPEAEMQLAELYLQRYNRARDERDADAAEELSLRASNSWYVQPDSAAMLDLRRRRVLVLQDTAMVAGDRTEARRDLVALLARLEPGIHYTGSADGEAIRQIVDFSDVPRRVYAKELSGSAALLISDHLQAELRRSAFLTSRVTWYADYAQNENHLLQVLLHLNLVSRRQVGDRLMQVARLLLGPIDEERDRSIRAKGLLVRATLLTHAAPLLVDADSALAARQAADAFDAVIDLPDVLLAASPPNLLDGMRKAINVLRHERREDSRVRAGELLMSAANELRPDPGMAPSQLLASTRLRKSAAGDISSLTSDPQSQAWAQVSIDAGLDLFDHHAREAMMDEAQTISHRVALVFISQSWDRACAAIFNSGRWVSVDLPDLALQAVGRIVVDAYKAHDGAGKAATERANDAERASVAERWRVARTALRESTRRAVQPLVDELDARLPVALHLTGLCHAIPIAPILASCMDHAQPVGVTLWQGSGSPTRTADHPFAAVVGAGDLLSYLPLVTDDGKLSAAEFGCGDERVLLDLSSAEALGAMAGSRVALLAGHGRASSAHPGDSHFALDRELLTARAILTADLGSTELVVVAACEGFAIDRQVNENALSVATACLYAGAASSVGSHWRVGNSEASAFSRLILAEVARGESVGESFRRASRSERNEDTFTLYLRHPDNLGVDAGGWSDAL